MSESLIIRNIIENVSIKDNTLFQKKHADSNATRKFDNSISIIEPDNIESYRSETKYYWRSEAFFEYGN